MAQLLAKRLICAGAALALSIGIVVSAASAGHVRLAAGGLELVMEPGDGALITLEVTERSCPPDCGFMDVSWHKERANPSFLNLGANRL